ncbi:urea ABC transporter permease subunit UrtB [Pannonibacter tanglangensis]|uniref:Urea ABC transporter permease subunit UrtB n=1 Tax=Pannonibacter tanglangensis TaxID=2750084 RepID=A0ABW9ZQX5_9HYPH|nr:urea ABC transporter permease subunit UrtB [Pannonibacter sp. XCT-34]NBN65976.1 urea ABC transporter permease subunit UrtB [Pannonibacter sp. XCT-34]
MSLKNLMICLLALVMGGMVQTAGRAQDGEALRPLVNALAKGGFKETEAQIGALAATGNPAVAPALEALAEGNLYERKSDGLVVVGVRSGADLALTDPLTGAALGTAPPAALTKVKVNNSLRRVIRTALGGLTLMAPDPSVRLSAAEAIFKSRDGDALSLLDQAMTAETDQRVRKAMDEARAAVVLSGSADDALKLGSIRVLAERGDRDALSVLTAVAGDASTSEPVREAATRAISGINQKLALWDAGQNIWSGISLGSVLLLAAIGLAITFGVMGVINMAHGEMVMIGAYVTFMVQEVIRSSAPGLFNGSLAIALPLAFLVTALIGICIERGIIRFLYGRPLETLLATWGLSLILQQAVRSIFGPTNREVGNPDWMSGAFQLGELTITYNRLWIVVFSLLVFAGLILVLKKTPFGLYTRAVTQNRRMAASMGIRTPWIDALTFGLGSGIAGIAGVALSQIDNVSPNLGQGYIIDSFMVVVFGGVGNLWGTLVGALTLGVVNKFLEPYAGAVLAKILMLVFIILFIQKRPRGLFALKGRAVEA